MFASRWPLIRQVCIYSRSLLPITQHRWQPPSELSVSSIKYFSCTHRLDYLPTPKAQASSLRKVKELRECVTKSGELPSNRMLNDFLYDIDRGVKVSSEDVMFLANESDRILREMFKRRKNAENLDLNAMQIIGLHVRAKNLPAAMELYSTIVAQSLTFTLDQYDGIVLMDYLINSDRAKDALELATRIREGIVSHKLSSKWKLFLSSLENRWPDSDFEQLYRTLLSRNVFIATSSILAPLVHQHLAADNVDKAVQMFYSISGKYRVTPCLKKILIKLIENKEVEHLERVVTIALDLHGKSCLYDLAAAFIECDRVAEARNIFEKISNTFSSPKLQAIADHFYINGNDEYLVRLHSATAENVNVHDRNHILENLIMARCRRSDPPDEILTLCDNMTSAPSTECILNVKYYLEKRNRALPDKWIEQLPPPLPSKAKSELHEMIGAGNKTDEAKAAVFQALDSGGNIQFDRATLRYFLSTSAKNGDVDTFDMLRTKLDEETKRHLLFTKFDCRAHIAADHCHEYLLLLCEEAIAANTNTKRMNLSKVFPLEAYEILEKDSNLCEKFQEMAIIYANKNVSKPMCLLWLHHFNCNNLNECDSLRKTHNLPDSILCKLGTQIFLSRKDAAKLKALTEALNNATIPKIVLAKMYESLLNTLLQQNQYDEIALVLKKAIDLLSVKGIKQQTLDKIQFGGNDLADAKTILAKTTNK